MKIYLSALILLFSFFGFSQKEKTANAIYSACQNDTLKDKCLYNRLQEKILSHYDSKAIEITEKDTKKDTILILSSLAVDVDGNIDPLNSYISSPDEYFDKLHQNLFKNLDSFIVEVDNFGNPLSEVVRTELYFSLDRTAKKLSPLPYEGNYSIATINFAIIEEVPVFPGCENYPENSLRNCFNQKMMEHISKNFRYPKKAFRKKISGRVNTMFTIDTKGNITEIRAFGADEILIKEARRIISLLPRITPGKQKGKPVRVPFAIPITFRLQ